MRTGRGDGLRGRELGARPPARVLPSGTALAAWRVRTQMRSGRSSGTPGLPAAALRASGRDLRMAFASNPVSGHSACGLRFPARPTAT